VWLWLPPLGRAAAVLAFAVIALAAAAPFVFVRVPAIADGKGAQGLAQSMQQQMGQGPGPGRTGRLGPPRAQQDTDPLGRPLRGREYGDDYTVKVPGEIDVQRARRIIEELRRRFGDVLRPQDELNYIERLLKDY
jgi:hypothetical protein